MQSTRPSRRDGNTGALIGIIIIVLVLAAGALYVWSMNKAKTPADTGTNQQAAEPSESADPKTAALEKTSSSDSASALEADLSATDTGNAAGELTVQ